VFEAHLLDLLLPDLDLVVLAVLDLDEAAEAFVVGVPDLFKFEGPLSGGFYLLVCLAFLHF